MFKHHFDQSPSNFVVLHWFMLSFNGGYINAGGFLATGKFVSHVTGFATLFGVNIINQQIHVAVGVLSVPIFFLLGAFAAGLLIDRPIHQGKKPHFDWVMGLSAFCLFLVAVGGEGLQFGSFGHDLEIKQTYILLDLLCLACGLQNGAITSSSGRSVRTTHLTGLTTDLGLGLARLLTFDFKKDRFLKEARANWLRMGSILSFIGGSAFGAWLFFRVGYRGFFLSGMIASYAAWHGKNAKLSAHELRAP